MTKKPSPPFDQPLLDIVTLMEDGEREAYSAYERRFEALLAWFLWENGDVDDVEDVEHLQETRGGRTLTSSARAAGFVMGFEHCRRVLNGRTRLAAPAQRRHRSQPIRSSNGADTKLKERAR